MFHNVPNGSWNVSRSLMDVLASPPGLPWCSSRPAASPPGLLPPYQLLAPWALADTSDCEDFKGLTIFSPSLAQGEAKFLQIATSCSLQPITVQFTSIPGLVMKHYVNHLYSGLKFLYVINIRKENICFRALNIAIRNMHFFLIMYHISSKKTRGLWFKQRSCHKCRHEKAIT
mgnify:CR=1 FL=1